LVHERLPAVNDEHQRFTQRYRPKSPIRGTDSARARKRFATLLFDLFKAVSNSSELWGNFANAIERELGVDVPSSYMSHDLTKFVQECELDDFLDSISVTYRITRAHYQGQKLGSHFLEFVARVFNEENLCYRIDERGMVHFRVDQQHEESTMAAIEALDTARFNAARDAFERARDDMQRSTPDSLGMTRNLFEAAESVFKTVTKSGSALDAAEVKKSLIPYMDRRMKDADSVAKRSAAKLVEGFADWVNACHPYRHGHDQAEAPAPPIEMAIALMGAGASYIRWLAMIDSQ
jgi:hypothetical protein